MEPLITIENLTKEFKIGSKRFAAIEDISLKIFRGETLGLVGESGSGKSTVGKTILRLHEPTRGTIFYKNINLTSLSKKHMKEMRQKMQIIFQDPYSSLNPRMTVSDIIREALAIHKTKQSMDRIEELLSFVGLNRSHLTRFPHEFSGGQRQRIGIARALAVEPEFIVCDEPISALDVSIQAQVVNLLKDIQRKMNLTYLFIAHDLAMVKYLSDRIAVIYLGKLMELGDSEDLFNSPLHPFTQALLSAIPIPDPEIERKRERIVLQGEIPNLINRPKGCPFASRCPKVMQQCHNIPPTWKEITPKHFVACHVY